jgi:hypothetical protein
MHTTFFVGNMNGRHHLGDISVDGRIILKRILNKYGVMMWTGFIWLRTGSSGELL